jgi:arabinose-5-phosphate isomerase
MTDQRLEALMRSALLSQANVLHQIAADSLSCMATSALHISTSERVLITGVGKSAFIAQKMSASLISIGIESRFLHPTDALHGDIGIVRDNTVLIVFSKSGQTEELRKLLDIQQLHSVSRIVVTASRNAAIVREGDLSIVMPDITEYDTDNLLPTASTTTSMAIADLLVASVASLLGSASSVLQITHPKGTIGKLVTTTVGEILPSLPALPVVVSPCSLKDALTVLHEHARGIVCGVNSSHRITGILTDGDVRRLVQTGQDLSCLEFDAVATQHPITVPVTATLHEALRLMEDRTGKISVLPIVDSSDVLQGVIHLHDVVAYTVDG